jgi:hypothetical protein
MSASVNDDNSAYAIHHDFYAPAGSNAEVKEEYNPTALCIQTKKSLLTNQYMIHSGSPFFDRQILATRRPLPFFPANHTTKEKAQPKASQAREPKDRPKKTNQKPREIQASIIGVETGTKAPLE